MRALVTGAGGQLGVELHRVLAAAGDDVVPAGRDRLDVTSRDQVLGIVLGLRPQVVFHCAAWTDVDGCEADPTRALLVNGLATRHMAEACRLAGSHLVALSTDYVFSGDATRPYVEWDEPAPRSAYGRSKLAAEREVAAGCPGAAVVRTSWLCGASGSNVVRAVLRLASDPARELTFVDDQVGSPTFTSDLAPLLRRLAVARLPGTFHATNQGAASWFGFAREVLCAAGQDPERVRAVATADLVPARPAPRPAYSVLEGAAMRGLGIDPLPDFRDPLARLVKELTHG
ncbi:MAG: dTDP-4-dehydrorhamnose reductase [Acidimicrobiales bacterium]